MLRLLRRASPALLFALAAASCDNGIESVDLNETPPAVQGFSIETGSGRLLLRWEFLDEVSPQLSFSGYKVYLKREGWETFQVWSAFQIRPGSSTHLPLLQEPNSLVDGRMEAWAVDLPNGKTHSFYVAGVQNGNEGPPSAILEDVPFKLFTNISIDEESRGGGEWYLLGTDRAELASYASDRVGYARDAETGRHHVRFRPIEEGGWLRLQNAGPAAGKSDAPTAGDGSPLGFHTDPALDRIEIGEGDYVFVWDTRGTAGSLGDDHFARLRVANIVEVPSDRLILIDCAYQSRPNTPNL
ncbi:MAG: fibronectin type III domain-containing protein [Candidatus Latescibacterota bacterium]|nr:MAG: fibronectin type III domain-containing protein [Candidatus Latescibacterota bacterium]